LNPPRPRKQTRLRITCRESDNLKPKEPAQDERKSLIVVLRLRSKLLQRFPHEPKPIQPAQERKSLIVTLTLRPELLRRFPPAEEHKSLIVVLRLRQQLLRRFPHGRRRNSRRRVSFDLSPVIHHLPPDPVEDTKDNRPRYWNRTFIGNSYKSLEAEKDIPASLLESFSTSFGFTSEKPSSPATVAGTPGDIEDPFAPAVPNSPAAAPEPNPERKKKQKKSRKRSKKAKMENSETPAPQDAPEVPSHTPLEEMNPYMFDFVPQVERVLSRLLIPPPALNPDGTPVEDQEQIPLHRRHLDIRDLNAAMNSVRANMAKAKAALLALPALDRTLEQQLAEEAFLRERERKQIEMLQKLRANISKFLVQDRKDRVTTEIKAAELGQAAMAKWLKDNPKPNPPRAQPDPNVAQEQPDQSLPQEQQDQNMPDDQPAQNPPQKT
jgi:hypothetical protein